MDNAERIAKIEAIHALLASPRTTRSERAALEQQLRELQQSPPDQPAATDTDAREAAIVAEFNAWMEELRNRPSEPPAARATSPETGQTTALATTVSPRLSKEQQPPSPPDPRSLQELQKLTPAEVSLWAARNPDEYLRLTTPPPKEEREPLFYKIMVGGKEIGRIDCFQYRELTGYYERALRAISACATSGRHSRERKCDCWLEYRNWLHSLQLRDPDSGLCLAASQTYDVVEAHSHNVKKTDAMAEGFEKLSAAMNVLQTTVAQAGRPAWMDVRRPAGNKLTQKLHDEVKAARKLGGKE